MHPPNPAATFEEPDDEPLLTADEWELLEWLIRTEIHRQKKEARFSDNQAAMDFAQNRMNAFQEIYGKLGLHSNWLKGER